ncbi:lymphocyte antigen 6E-like [Emys orbicularis]|uniref:lymphocyte antigen 6E-like n=1 Tax=Emys orbicularis TaxID=82168 RepID=UPI0031FD5B18
MSGKIRTYGHSLMCYTCQGETSNKYCMKISMCAKEDNYCVTIKDVVGAGYKSKYRISKMCSPECPKTIMKQGKTGAKVFCCDKLLCNVNGASSMETSYSMISMGILANFIYIFRSGL